MLLNGDAAQGMTCVVLVYPKIMRSPKNSNTDLDDCSTPLIGSNNAIGVWMIVIVDDEASMPHARRFKVAPPVSPRYGRHMSPTKDDRRLEEFAMMNGPPEPPDSMGGGNEDNTGSMGSIRSFNGQSVRSGSPYTLTVE